MIDERGYAVLVVEGEADARKMTGVIRTDTELYRIEPLDDGQGLHALIRVDRSKLRMNDDTPKHEGKEPDLGRSDQQILHQREEGAPIHEASKTNATTTPIRVLTVYTAAAKSAYSNITSRITTAIQEANNALIDSGVYLINGGSSSYSFSDRKTAQVSYNENASSRTYEDHVNLLQGGSIPNVHSWRDTFGADVVVMIVADDSDPEHGGQAYAINASASGAFVVVNDDFLTGENVYDHEIGHLIGGKHNNDPSSSPGKAYGHGYITTGQGRATVMVQGGVDPRIPYWSDPDLTYQGEVLGTSNFADMVRVLKERSGTVAGFRSDPTLSVTISGPNSIPSGQNGTWTANPVGGGTDWPCYKWFTRPISSSTWTQDYYTCSNPWFTKHITQPIYMYVEANDEFQTATSPLWYVTSSGAQYTLSSDEAVAALSREAFDADTSPSSFSLDQNYPNPFNPTTMIQFTVPEATSVSLAVYDVMGRKVAQLLNEVKESGVHRVAWDASSLPSGMYYYQLKAGTFVQTKHMVLMK